MKEYKIIFFAKGGHGAEPHEAIDATIIASEFIRKISTYTFCEVLSFVSGDAFNVISGKAYIVLKTNNIEKIKNTASALLIYYGDETRFEIEEA